MNLKEAIKIHNELCNKEEIKKYCEALHIVCEKVEIGANKRPQEIRTMSLKINPILNSKELQAINNKCQELGWM